MFVIVDCLKGKEVDVICGRFLWELIAVHLNWMSMFVNQVKVYWNERLAYTTNSEARPMRTHTIGWCKVPRQSPDVSIVPHVGDCGPYGPP